MSLILLSRRRGGASGGGGSLAITISPTTSSRSLNETSSTTVNFTLTRSGGFTGTVTPVASGLPTGVTASFSPTTFGAGVTSMVMTLTSSSAPLITNDAYTVTFSGSGVSDAVYNGTVTVQAGGSWPNATASTFGPGANAPAWSGKTTYPAELFNTPIPVHYDAANAAGFKGYQGFDFSFGGPAFNPSRVVYPDVVTPFGNKKALEIRFPGQTTTITAVSQTTPTWPHANDQPYAVKIRGTWVGTLAFEVSTDSGVTWNPVSLRNDQLATNATSATASTTDTRPWYLEINNPTTGLFRVRASSWTSGSASVTVGMRGGDAPARLDAGGWTGSPSKIYNRVAFYADADWTNSDNLGTKFFFFSSDQGNGHYTGSLGGVANEAFGGTFVGLQGNGLNRNMAGTAAIPNGQWFDIEYLFEANTPGVSNGVVRAWVNGVLSQELTDVQFFASGATPVFDTGRVDPTYGGGANPPPYTTYFRLGAWYRESAS